MQARMENSQSCSVPTKWSTSDNVECNDSGFVLSTNEENAQITFDYERAEGGMPYVEIGKITSNSESVEVDVIFSETFAGSQAVSGRCVRYTRVQSLP